MHEVHVYSASCVWGCVGRSCRASRLWTTACSSACTIWTWQHENGSVNARRRPPARCSLLASPTPDQLSSQSDPITCSYMYMHFISICFDIQSLTRSDCWFQEEAARAEEGGAAGATPDVTSPARNAELNRCKCAELNLFVLVSLHSTKRPLFHHP